MSISHQLNEGFQILGFDKEQNQYLFLCDDISKIHNLEIKIHLERAKLFNAKAVFFRKELDRYKPQIYIYDFTRKLFKEKELTKIHRKIWSDGKVPLVCAFYDTEIKILDCTTHITDGKPKYLAHLELLGEVHSIYNKLFAVKIKTGTFWDEEENRNKFKFKSSSYDILIQWIKEIINQTTKSSSGSNEIKIVKKVIIQAIMIKYLEERKDEYGNSPFNEKYVQKYNRAKDFIDVLESGYLINLLEDLQKDLNGNLFDWSEEEKQSIKYVDLRKLIEALKAYKKPEEINNPILELIKYYEFSFIPVELISRIYEEFLAGDTVFTSQKKQKQKDGIYYTPSHLAQLLVDECMPLHSYNQIDLKKYKILDPACGSGVFLVLAFKRLVQWWRLQNNFKHPSPQDLRFLLKCIYGVDKEEQATKLTAFSLCIALCDNLTPKQVISDLKFIDLTINQILYSDFFIDEKDLEKESDLVKRQANNLKKITTKKFDLIIGNPPFDRGALSDYSDLWEEYKIKIPQGQIALKFLVKSLSLLKRDGLLSLIIKSSSLLYNTTSEKFKEVLFSNYNIAQVFDFTPLARNKALWDNDADVAAAAIFIKNSPKENNKNLLHLIFHRTRTTVERLVFDIDESNFHFISNSEAIQNPFIWKINLLGGGRIKSLINKTRRLDIFEDYLIKNNCIQYEGFIAGTKGKLKPDYIYKLKTLPTKEGISEEGIDYSSLESIDKSMLFQKVPPQEIFTAPNLIIWENIGEKKLPIFYNDKKSFSFRHKVIGIKSNDSDFLKLVAKNFEENSDFYRFYMLCTSSQLLINKNTALLKKDYMTLPYLENRNDFINTVEQNIISDVNNYYQFFLRNGEKSILAKEISKENFEERLEKYGEEYSKILNIIYGEKENFFYLKEVITLDSNFIACIFKYGKSSPEKIKYSKEKIGYTEELINFDIYQNLSSNRIIRIYNVKDSIIIIKPNQLRYWIDSSAYRDADKTIVDLNKMGY